MYFMVGPMNNVLPFPTMDLLFLSMKNTDIVSDSSAVLTQWKRMLESSLD